MKFANLGSSSAGNCYYLELDREHERPVKLMIEIGFSKKEILKKCIQNNINFNEIDAFLITHSHKDHSQAFEQLDKEKRKVYADHTIQNKINLQMHEKQSQFIAVDTLVTPFRVEHDTEMALGYIIQTSKENILFINDCKYFKSDLSKYKFDFIFIEANYDGQMLHFAYEDAKEKNNFQKIKQYERLFDAHMSIANCCKHLKKLDLSNCKAVFLMHLSDGHANENLFRNKVQELGVKCVICKKHEGLA